MPCTHFTLPTFSTKVTAIGKPTANPRAKRPKYGRIRWKAMDNPHSNRINSPTNSVRATPSAMLKHPSPVQWPKKSKYVRTQCVQTRDFGMASSTLGEKRRGQGYTYTKLDWIVLTVMVQYFKISVNRDSEIPLILHRSTKLSKFRSTTAIFFFCYFPVSLCASGEPETYPA